MAIFMVFYKYILEKENMHVFKRYYLLGALVLAFTIPLVTFTEYIEVIATPEINEGAVHYIQNVPQIEQTNYLPLILWSIYSLGVVLFGIKFLLNLFKIIFKINRNPKKKSNHIVHVLLSDMITPHTFFKYIFLNKQKFENKEIPQEVFWHEEAHAIQNHSIDVLFVELLQVIFWFNPIIYFTKHSIKMNHEYLADRAVLNKGVNATNYQHILLAFSSNASTPIGMANAINYSSIRLKVFGKQITLFNAFGQIKKRFTVMKTHTTKQKVWLKSLVLLPLLALTLYGFSEKKEIVKEATVIETSQNKVSLGLSETSEQKMYSETPQQKATAEEVAEYNKLAKQINSQPPNKTVIRLKDVKRLRVLYDKMSKEQQANAEPMPNFPPPPPPPPPVAAGTTIKRLPLPAPPPPNATAEQLKSYEKAVQDYKAEQNYTYKHKTKEGKEVEVLVIPDVQDHLPPPPPPPNAPKVLKTNTNKKIVLLEDWYITINNKRHYYPYKGDQSKYYDQYGKEITSSIVNEYKKKYDLFEKLINEEPHYIHKTEKEKKAIDHLFSDLGGMYFRMPKTDRTRVVKPINPISPYIMLIKTNGEIYYKLKSELTDKDRELLPPPPPPPPVSPLVHIENMAKKNALFFYEGKAVTSGEAIRILKSDISLNISTTQSNTNQPKVNITKDPIIIND